MAVLSVIKLSELEGAKILAPEFYHPDKIIIKRYLENACTKKIKDCFYNVKEIFDPKITYLTKQGVVFDLSDVTSYFLHGGKKVTSSEEVGSAKKIFFQNDVLISRLRPYLKEVSFIGFNEKLKLASTEFIVLRQKDNRYYPETLFAYLISKEVQNILAWSITGTEHPRFNEDYFLKLPLPAFSEDIHKKIKIIVQSAWKIFLKSLDFYSQAETLFLEELGLNDFKPKYEKTYTANLSSAFSAHRIDAEYFQPAYEEVDNMWRKTKTSLLSNVADCAVGFAFPSEDLVPSERFPVIKMNNLTAGSLVNLREYEGIKDNKKYGNIEHFAVKKGDILIGLTGSLGSVAFYLEERLAYLNQRILRVRPQKISPEVLLVILRSDIFRKYLERTSLGGVQPNVRPEDAKKFPIPILPHQTQQKIASLVQQSHEARRKAKELLEVAKKAVEIAIEKNEKEALRDISKAEGK